MVLDLVYLSYNRLEFTKKTFELLLANTDWEHVSKVFLYDDNSYDGTKEFLDEARSQLPVESELDVCCRRSPVEVMNAYTSNGASDLFCKLDNDVALPPGWLSAMVGVMERSPELELLGMEAGFPGIVSKKPPAEYTYTPWSHIGGVGLMRTDAFRRRLRIPNRGRFGFSEWQDKNEPVRGWITPELMVPQLDRIPLEPYLSLSEEYVRQGWQRQWPKYAAQWTSYYYDWFTEDA